MGVIKVAGLLGSAGRKLNETTECGFSNVLRVRFI